ncbi:hypothetical protein [Streptomyces sp. 2-1]|uniref:hypothetical protein n=1 Tax=Streptomyces sp. 2-1 TaxID=412710 RepID=UPI003AFB0E25
MTDHQQATSSDPDADALDRPLTLAVLRQLVRSDWRGLPDATLVVLPRDVEGNAYSPFATYSRSCYAPTYDLVGEVYPLPEELEQDEKLRELFADGIPDSAVPAWCSTRSADPIHTGRDGLARLSRPVSRK